MTDGKALIREAITEHYGEKCADYCEGCACCEAWKAYEEMDVAPKPAALVKPLAWGRSSARTPFGNYIVTCEDHDTETVWFVMFGGRVVADLGAHSTEDSAKAAAQVDYVQRILSTIDGSAGCKVAESSK